MYVGIGNDIAVKEDEIIGFFDLDNTTVSKITRNYLSLSQKKKQVNVLTHDLPKTFVVCSNKKSKNKVYLSQFSPSTLIKRIKNKEII